VSSIVPHDEGLTRQRCFNHALREAAARCPACGRYFCRECVTEHEGRMICASCLRRSRGEGPRGRRVLAAALRVGGGLLGSAAAWAFFYWLGRLLLRLPTPFHEGNLWVQ